MCSENVIGSETLVNFRTSDYHIWRPTNHIIHI
jgi:hypothetical protein